MSHALLCARVDGGALVAMPGEVPWRPVQSGGRAASVATSPAACLMVTGGYMAFAYVSVPPLPSTGHTAVGQVVLLVMQGAAQGPSVKPFPKVPIIILGRGWAGSMGVT